MHAARSRWNGANFCRGRGGLWRLCERWWLSVAHWAKAEAIQTVAPSKDCHAPRKRGIQYAEAFRFYHQRLWIWITRFRGWWRLSTRLRSRGAMRPRFAWIFSLSNGGSRECRVHAAPAVSCANSAQKTHTSIQVQTEHSGIPCAMALRLMPSSPRRRIRLASVVGELAADQARSGRLRLRQLDTSNGCQDHTVLPYADRLRQEASRTVHFHKA